MSKPEVHNPAAGILLTVMVLPTGCIHLTDPYELLSAGKEANVKGRLFSGLFAGEFPLLRDKNGREYMIAKLPADSEWDALAVEAKAMPIRKVRLPSGEELLEVSLTNLRPALPEVSEWDKLFVLKPADLHVYLNIVEDFRRRFGIPLPFWPEGVGEPRDEVVSFQFSGCGNLHVAFVKNLSASIQHKSLQPDSVFEFDGRGTVINSWMIPGNHTVDGIHGNEILVGYAWSPILRSGGSTDLGFQGTYLRIDRSGEFHLTTIEIELAQPVESACPNIEEFKGSAYTRCGVFTDVVSGAPRRLAYQSPCT